MATAHDVVAWLNLGAYAALGAVALFQWRERRSRAALWAALAFGALGVIVLGGRVIPDDEEGVAVAAERLLVVSFVLFPYFLYRFMRSFAPQSSAIDRLVVPLTVGLVIATVVLPRFPDEGEARPGWFWAYLIAFVVHWTMLSVLVSVRLWLAGRGQPTVARRRMRALASGSAGLTLAIILIAFAGDEDTVGVVVQLVALGAALTFMLGLAPPTAMRVLWRRREQEEFSETVARLMRVNSEEEVAAAVLPPLGRFVGADAVELRGSDGRTIASYGSAADHGGQAPLELALDHVVLRLWASPYTPFFGDEELRLARALAALTTLALDRTRLFAREREAREALERADELKTQFIALAAHELRSPVAAIYGTIDTLDRLAARLTEEERQQLRTLLRSQTERLRMLIDQLLDLSRLDADAIKLQPTPIRVRDRVDGIVSSVVGQAVEELDVDVDPDLEAVVDEEAFDRIVSNLVGNAVKYGAPPVRVTAAQRDRHFRLAVEDRGTGVTAEFAPLLFERFARSGEAMERAPGTGLGLAIARSYARAHGGDLFYEPAQPQGARFELVIPRTIENAVGAR